jgi:hypothetical protein
MLLKIILASLGSPALIQVQQIKSALPSKYFSYRFRKIQELEKGGIKRRKMISKWEI